MSHGRTAALPHFFVTGVLILVLPAACAEGVAPEAEGESVAGSSSDSGANAGGASAGTGVIPTAGTSSSSGGSVSNAFGGTSSSGGSTSNAFGGTSSSGGTSSAGAGGKGGSGGASGGAGGGGASGGAGGAGGTNSAGAGGTGGACACLSPKAWMDNTSINFVAGDCFTVGTAKYAYLGATMSTYANKECNPAMQEAWCADSGFKFMACP